MKPTIPALLLMTAATLPVGAAPFTLRPVPAGYQTKTYQWAGLFFSPVPVVVDIGTGRNVWYGGGSNFSTYPYAPNPLDPQFTIDLPAVAIPNFPNSTAAPEAGVPCDVDRDGDMDIVRINSWNGFSQIETFHVFLNNGTGSFTKGQRLDTTYPVVAGLTNRDYHIDTADFDRDGDPDVAILMTPDVINPAPNPERYEGTLTIRWNDGTGVFSTSTVLQASGFAQVAGMALGDVDRDGDVDILCDDHTTIINGESLSISLVYKNSGTGTFTTFSEGRRRPARFADLNRDGWLDTGFRNFTGLNNGAGSIADISLFPNFAGTAVKDYTYVDADGDGILDLVTNSGNNLVYFNGDGTGGFTLTATTMVTLPSPAAGIGAGDSDSDGDMDFFLHLNNGSSAFVENRSLHQAAGGTLFGGPGTAVISVPGVTELHTADFDRDGREDLVTVSPSQKKLEVIFGGADGDPSAPVLLRSLASTPHSAAVGDFDLDGRTDVAYTVPGTGEVRQARNIPGLLTSWPDSVIANGLAGVSLLKTGTLGTPNGRADLLTGNATTGQVRWLYQSAGSWTGQTALSSFAPVPGAILTGNASTRPGDEFFLLAADGSNLQLRSYQLNPTWAPLGSNLSTPVSTSPLAEVLAWADVTGDGRQEIVFLKGDGALAFWDPISAAGGAIGAATGAIRAITPVDWDCDGRADILCATTNGVSLFTMKGAWREVRLLETGSYDSVTTIDINRDAWRDAAVGSSASGSVTFLTNLPLVLVAEDTSAPQVSLVNGQPGATVSFNATSQGNPANSTFGLLADASAVVSGVNAYFYRAVANGASWSKGTALTPTEANQIVSSLALVSGSTVIANGNIGAIAGGRVTADYAAGSGTLVPITPGSTQPLQLRLTPTAAASQSPNARFFMELNFQIKGYAQDGISTASGIPVSGIQPVLVTIIPVLTALQQWRQANLGNWQSTGNAANDADPDGDSIPNLMEYVTSQNPNSATGLGAGPVIGLTRDAGLNTMIADLRLLTTYDSKVRLTLQYSLNPATGWSQFSTRTGTGAWSLAPLSTTLLSGGSRTRFNFDGGNPAIFPKAFYRLKAEELP